VHDGFSARPNRVYLTSETDDVVGQGQIRIYEPSSNY